MTAKDRQLGGDGYEALGNAIVIQAADDYQSHRKKLKSLQQKVKEEQWQIDDIRNFFKGEWIKMLTEVDGESILKKLDEQELPRKKKPGPKPKKDEFWRDINIPPEEDDVYVIAVRRENQVFVWISEYVSNGIIENYYGEEFEIGGKWLNVPKDCEIVAWAPRPSVECFNLELMGG